MKLSKHKPHRNQAYLNWLRKRNCVVSDKVAECAHHIRLGTNGGVGLKPSDYFCVPLTNEYHTTGSYALHIVGEETFLKHFKLEPHKIFVHFLKEYLAEKFDFFYTLKNRSDEQMIEDLITVIEVRTLKVPKLAKKKPTRSKLDPIKEKMKEEKKEKDKELRKKIRVQNKNKPAPKKSEKDKEFYEISKAFKRVKDRKLREKLKSEKNESKAYQEAKESHKLRQKELREKNKKKASLLRKKMAKKIKKSKI